MRIKKVFICLLLSFVLLCGCSSSAKLADEKIVFYDVFSLNKDGILYYLGDKVTITDYNTGISVPLCDKSNCKHESASRDNENPQCNAVYPGSIETAFLFHDNLYVFVYDGMNHTSVYMSNSTGEGRRKIAEADCTWSYYSVFFSDCKLYFVGEYTYYKEENLLQQEKELFICSFDTETQKFENVTAPNKNLSSIAMRGIVNDEIYYSQYTHINESEFQIDFIAKNLLSGEENRFLDEDGISDYVVTDSDIYYVLRNNESYEYWKKEIDGEKEFQYSTDMPVAMKPIIGGKVLFDKDKSEFQKQLHVLCTYGDLLFITDSRENGKHGVITTDNYLNDIDNIIYPEFPGIIYFN